MNTTVLDQSFKARAKKVIERLQGVVGSHLRIEGDSIGTIFVQSDGTRDPRKIVRDVEAILATELGVEIDFRKISVASTAPRGPELRQRAPRLAFVQVRIETSGLESEARVELGLDAARVLGIARGPSTRAGSRNLVAEACLRAAQRFVEEPVVFALGGVDRVRVGRDRLCAVTVRMIRGRDEKLLTGSSPLGGDDLRTVAYATLDAINRVFERLRVREPVEYVLGASDTPDGVWDG